MRFLACLGLILLLSKQSVSQDSLFIIYPGARIDQAIHSKELYQYPEFKIGKVYFRDGRVVEAQMNYNRFTDEMFFVGVKRDTLILDDEETIRLVNIEKDSFYFNCGYIRLAQSNNVIKLGAKFVFKPAGKKESDNFYAISLLSTLSNLSSFEVGTARYGSVAKEQIAFIKTMQYYFGDKFDHYVPASQKDLANMFPKFSSDIKKYCSKNKIDFQKIADLEKVLAFVETTCK